MSVNEARDVELSIRMKKGFYIVLGTIALALGFLGLLLPVLPTTPFVILAAACYTRGSEPLYNKLRENKWFGETITTYQSGQGLRKEIKVKAIGLMWIFILVSAVLYVKSLPVQFLMLGIAILVTSYLLVLPTYVDEA